MANEPNIVIIMTDQQRADLCAREGYPLDTTPFLDGLAREGVWFNHAYTTAPACVPARASMLTGRYPSATRVRTNHNAEDATFVEDLFGLLRRKGYLTGLCGKNHSYLKRGDTDYWYEASHLHAEDENDSDLYRGFKAFMEGTHFHMAREATPLPLEAQFPYRIVSHAEGWIRSIAEAGRPFALWLSFPEPHNPYQAPEPYYSLFPPETLPQTVADEAALEAKGFAYRWCRHRFEEAFPGFRDDLPRARANYLGMLRLLDDQIARFVAFLRAEGLYENTLLVFLSDHGDFVGEYGLARKGPDLPEALTRIPLIVAGPGIPSRRQAHPAHVSIADVMPTLCEAVGAELPPGVQGRSLWPLLTGRTYPVEEFASIYVEHGFGGLYYGADEALGPADDGFTISPDGVHWGGYDCLNSWTQCGQVRMLRRGEWKLIFDMQGQGQLYNLSNDPAECRNLYDDPAYLAKRHELLEDLMAWTLRTQDPLPLPRRRYVLKTDPRNYWSPYR
jgi:arylsulfatase A-like enzyme